jgi:hypothetical protein
MPFSDNMLVREMSIKAFQIIRIKTPRLVVHTRTTHVLIRCSLNMRPEDTVLHDLEVVESDGVHGLIAVMPVASTEKASGF